MRMLTPHDWLVIFEASFGAALIAGLVTFVIHVESKAPPDPVVHVTRLHPGECFRIVGQEPFEKPAWKVESTQEQLYIIRKVPDSIYRNSIGYMLPVGVEQYLHRIDCKEAR